MHNSIPKFGEPVIYLNDRAVSVLGLLLVRFLVKNDAKKRLLSKSGCKAVWVNSECSVDGG